MVRVAAVAVEDAATPAAAAAACAGDVVAVSAGASSAAAPSRRRRQLAVDSQRSEYRTAAGGPAVRSRRPFPLIIGASPATCASVPCFRRSDDFFSIPSVAVAAAVRRHADDDPVDDEPLGSSPLEAGRPFCASHLGPAEQLRWPAVSSAERVRPATAVGATAAVPVALHARAVPSLVRRPVTASIVRHEPRRAAPLSPGSADARSRTPVYRSAWSEPTISPALGCTTGAGKSRTAARALERARVVRNGLFALQIPIEQMPHASRPEKLSSSGLIRSDRYCTSGTPASRTSCPSSTLSFRPSPCCPA